MTGLKQQVMELLTKRYKFKKQRLVNTSLCSKTQEIVGNLNEKNIVMKYLSKFNNIAYYNQAL